jgi:hypothetical protein
MDPNALMMLFAGDKAAAGMAAGFGQYEQGQEQKAAYDYNAQVTLDEMQGKMQTSEAKYSNLIGRQATAYARAGVDISSGSPLLMMAHTAAQSGKEQMSEAQAGDQEAALQRYYGKVAAWSGTISGISTAISALSQSGMSMAGSMNSGGYGGYGGADLGQALGGGGF